MANVKAPAAVPPGGGAGEKAHDRQAETAADRGAKEKKKALLQMRTEEYADDSILYKPRLTTEDRQAYWSELVKYKPRRKPGRSHDSWIKKEELDADTLEKRTYFPGHRDFLHFVASARWDYLYLILLLIWVAILVLSKDGFLPPGVVPAGIEPILPLLMIVAQIVPIMGAVFHVHWRNDLIRCFARGEFEQWSFCLVLVAQYVEFFHYGGRGQSHLAGGVRRTAVDGTPLNEEDFLEDEEIEERRKCSYKIKRLFGCGSSAIHPEDESDGDASSVLSGTEYGAGSRAPSVFSDGEGDGGGTIKSSSAGSMFGRMFGRGKGKGRKGEGSDTDSVMSGEDGRAGGWVAGLEGIEEGEGGEGGEGDIEMGSSTLEEGDSQTNMGSQEGGGEGGSVEGATPLVAKELLKQGERAPSVGLAVSNKGPMNPAEAAAALAGQAQGGGGGGGGEEEEVVTVTTHQSSNYLDQAAEEAAEELRRKEREAMLAKAAANALVKEWLEWTCVVCGQQNKENRHPEINSSISFGIQGVYYKRVFATINHERDMPRCPHCLTYADYEPPTGSAHLFPHNPDPHAAFEDFPPAPEVQSGLSMYPLHQWMAKGIEVFRGLRDNPKSRMLYPDWRSRVFVSSKYPELPRAPKPPQEFYEVGETVECKVQRSDWNRAKIRAVHINGSYDLEYENGVPLRYVMDKDLRTLPEKREYAYRVEMCVVLGVVMLPLSLIGIASGSGSILSGLFLLVPAGLLTVLQIWRFVSAVYKHYEAGLLVLLGMFALYSLPVWLLLAEGVQLGSTAPGTYLPAANLFIAAMFLSLPALYTIKPAFAVLLLPLFVQVGGGLYLLANAFDGSPIILIFPHAIAAGPIVTAIFTLLLYRLWLDRVWDVSLKIRPTKARRDSQREVDEETLAYKIFSCFQELTSSETVLGTAWDTISNVLGAFSKTGGNRR